jgi:branched-subunit amino acid ABC-type transport system permease component
MTAYLTWMFMRDLGFSLISAIIATIIIHSVFAPLLYRTIVRRYLIKEEYLLTALLLVALIFDEVVNYVYPPEIGVSIPTVIMPGETKIGASTVPNQLIAGAFIAIALTASFTVFFLKSKMGLQIRSVTQDVYCSKLMGINVERLYTIVFLLALIPPIIGTYLCAPVYGVLPGMGWTYYMQGILVSILGGLGNLKGTIMGSYLLGFVNSFVAFILHEPRMMSIAALVFVTVILIIRPQGLARSESLW